MKVILQQLHVPQLCKCPYHQENFTCSTAEHEFISHKEMVEKLEKWHKMQGENPCFVYSVVKVS